MEKNKACIIGYHTNNKDTKPESNGSVSWKQISCKKDNKIHHIGRKEHSKTNKETDTSTGKTWKSPG